MKKATKKIKQTLILTLAVTMLLGNSVDIRAAAYRESKLSLYGMNNGAEREVRLSVNAKGQLQAIIKNERDKKGKAYNAKIVYKKNGKKASITKIRKNSKEIFADGYTAITRGEKTYKIKIKGSKAILSIYDKTGKKTRKFDCSKIKEKYKKMKATQMLFVSKNRVRVLYGNTDNSGVPYGGGSIILNLSTGKAKREAAFTFMPQGYSKGKVYALFAGNIFMAEVKNGKNVTVFKLPPGDAMYSYDAVSYRNGILLYVNKNGAYMAKDTDQELKLVHSFAESKMATKFVRCAAVVSKKCFYVGFAPSEDDEPTHIVKYLLK